MNFIDSIGRKNEIIERIRKVNPKIQYKTLKSVLRKSIVERGYSIRMPEYRISASLVFPAICHIDSIKIN